MKEGRQKKYPHVAKKGNLWWYNVYENGKLKWPAGYATPELAYNAYEEAIKDKAGKDTVADIINKYYELWGNKHLSKNSLHLDRTCIRNYINPLLGKIKVADLTKVKILQFQNDVMEKAGGEQKPGIVSTNLVINTLSKIFNKAVELDLMSINPAQKIKKLSIPKRNYPVLTPEQLFYLLDNVKGKDKYIIAIASLAGARRGEVFGFQWQDIDLKNGRISFNRQIQSTDIKDKLKTQGSHAIIDMLPDLIDLLKEWRLQCREEAVWLFENTFESHINPAGWIYRNWSVKIRPKYDFLKDFRFHDLKHTYASLLISKGLQPKEIQQLCRHATLAMTMDTYGHLFPDDVKKKIISIRFDK